MKRTHTTRTRATVVATLVAMFASLQPVSVATPAYADTVSEARDEWNRLREMAEAKTDELVNTRLCVTETEESLRKTEGDLKSVTAELDVAREKLSRIVAEEYKNPTEPTLDAVLGVSSLAELTEMSDYHDRIMRIEQSAVDEVTAKANALEETKVRLETERGELASLVAEQESALDEAKAAEEDAKALYASLSDDARREIAEADIKDRARAREEADAIGTTLATDTDGASEATESLVERAYEIIGSGYSWSGYSWTGSPESSAFTCSGVVDYALGLPSCSNSPESLYAQVGNRMVFDTSQLSYGDVVFYAFGGRVPTGHTGVYIGNGLIIDSIPNGGVQIRDVNYMEFVGGGPIL